MTWVPAPKKVRFSSTALVIESPTSNNATMDLPARGGCQLSENEYQSLFYGETDPYPSSCNIRMKLVQDCNWFPFLILTSASYCQLHLRNTILSTAVTIQMWKKKCILCTSNLRNYLYTYKHMPACCSFTVQPLSYRIPYPDFAGSFQKKPK